MSNTVKVDARAFGRGVDEILLLKPVRRAVSAIVYGRKKTVAPKSDAGSQKTRRGNVVKCQSKHDEPAA